MAAVAAEPAAALRRIEELETRGAAEIAVFVHESSFSGKEFRKLLERYSTSELPRA
ncbi:hypothetical protein [Terrarubrum flagellatum]|uniref:hypothetical protein n=1 Tax=Terrirubrum flagellatum TaxID=2895980 RepID=UPI003144D92E